MIRNIKRKNGMILQLDGKFGSGVIDKHGREIFEEDTLQIDFDKAAKVIGDGLLIRELEWSKPNQADARLKVEFRHARFRLVWRTRNGGVDTGKDVFYLIAIPQFVEVVED
ncbi:MAG: hypothetical protein IJP68_10190 [Selenomonadaceae bacterium]|nr:hypothetical protein [Selenomonadaceae bacterium]